MVRLLTVRCCVTIISTVDEGSFVRRKEKEVDWVSRSAGVEGFMQESLSLRTHL